MRRTVFLLRPRRAEARRKTRCITPYDRARMSTVDRKYWLLSIAAGLAVGLLAMLIMLLRVDSWFIDASHFVGPALFGAVFVYCLRSTVGINWWRGLCLLLGIVAAHFGALWLAVNIFTPGYLAPWFTYGAAFALVVAALAVLLFPPARNTWLVAATVLASGLVALNYLPLRDIVRAGERFFISHTATWVTFGLVYAVVPVLFGAFFVYCLRSIVGINWWRGLCLLMGIVAAHTSALYGLLHVLDAVDRIPVPDGGQLEAAIQKALAFFLPPFTYGATFALVVAALVALLFPPARSAWLAAVTVLASGLVALSYWPLEDIVPRSGGFFVSDTAASVASGLVYAVVAALLGWRLFEKKAGANA